VDAAEVVDLVDEAVALARRRGVVGIVVLAAHVDALGGADTRAQLAADALLHAVLVPVEDVSPVEPLGLRDLLVVVDRRIGALAALARVSPTRVLGGDLLAAEQPVLLDRDGEPFQISHQLSAP
jgi:hypothetical protein